MIYTINDGVFQALERLLKPELKRQLPKTSFAILDLAVKRFERRANFLGLSDQMAEQAVKVGIDRVATLSMHAESPLERAIGPWLVFEDYGEHFLTIPAQIHIPKIDAVVPPCDLFIVPQFAFARFRVDFAVVGIVRKVRRIVAVECDGADYHADYFRDAARDSYLKSWGIETVRARGSKIYAEPHVVSAQVVEALLRGFQ